MTHGERFGSGGITSTASRPTTGHDSPSRSEAVTVAAAQRALPWDELFARATAAQQDDLLALARRQGFVYGHQLPIITNGVSTFTDRADSLLQNLLAGRVDALQPFPLTEVEFQDG